MELDKVELAVLLAVRDYPGLDTIMVKWYADLDPHDRRNVGLLARLQKMGLVRFSRMKGGWILTAKGERAVGSG